MAEYDVVLFDKDGFEICAELIDGLSAAKARAAYLLSDDHARNMETTHDALGTEKAEVQAASTGNCIWDKFRRVDA